MSMRPSGKAVAAIAFVVGAASLGTEIAAARLLAPWFGASTIVWANTIATVLVALAAGYWLGGRIADRDPTLRGLCRLVLGAAVLLAAVPFVAGPFLRVSVRALDDVDAGAFVGSLIAVLALIAVPVLLLGAVAPYAVRLSVVAVEEAGRVAGRLYAISTVGSLCGVFLAALVLVPFAGTRRTFLVFAIALATVALLGAGRRLFAAPLALCALVAIPDGQIKTANGARVLLEDETAYQYARVVERPDGTRRLQLNEGHAVHSLWRPGSVLTGDYWDDMLVLPFAVLDRPPARVAILGNAAGTTARALGRYYPRTFVDAVEIDPRLTEIGRRLFGLRGPRLRIHHADARPFLRRSEQRYDAILVDAYRQPYIPFYLATREFFQLASDHLAPGGVVVVNAGHPRDSRDLERALTATMRAALPSVWRAPTQPTNTILLGASEAVSPARLAQASLDPGLRSVAARTARLLEPGLSGGEVWTDDRAPVEWLIDGSVLRVAARGTE